MYIALLGRQPELSIAELERVYGTVEWFSASTALVDSSDFQIQRLGGTQKAGKITLEIPSTDWRRISQEIVHTYGDRWKGASSKITLGISAYDLGVSAREVQKVGLLLKGQLKRSGVSIRLVPNQEATLSTATSHHNKLGLSDNKIELLIVASERKTVIAESTGAQNITALAARDQGRPRRDAFVGMLPPKFAQIMVNLATGNTPNQRVLDPFCGTGVILQEAALMGHPVYGTDLSEKMIRYSQDNLVWLQSSRREKLTWDLHEGDAMTTKWNPPLQAVVSEVYLGQPFSAPPSATKLTEVRGNCTHITGAFLGNISKQLSPGTPVVLAVPAWRRTDDSFVHLSLENQLQKYGFERIQLKTVEADRLMYFRPEQVVARELLVLIKK